MPHVSPQKIDDKTLKEISSFLFSALTEKNMLRKQQRSAFNELLTKTEKIMLGKRLTAISMLSENKSPYEVGKKLHLSPTTTMKLQLKLESGELSNIKKLCGVLRKGPLGQYIDNLLKPLPKYGTPPHKLFNEM